MQLRINGADIYVAQVTKVGMGSARGEVPVGGCRVDFPLEWVG